MTRVNAPRQNFWPAGFQPASHLAEKHTPIGIDCQAKPDRERLGTRFPNRTTHDASQPFAAHDEARRWTTGWLWFKTRVTYGRIAEVSIRELEVDVDVRLANIGGLVKTSGEQAA